MKKIFSISLLSLILILLIIINLSKAETIQYIEAIKSIDPKADFKTVRERFWVGITFHKNIAQPWCDLQGKVIEKKLNAYLKKHKPQGDEMYATGEAVCYDNNWDVMRECIIVFSNLKVKSMDCSDSLIKKKPIILKKNTKKIKRKNKKKHQIKSPIDKYYGILKNNSNTDKYIDEIRGK